MTTFLWMLYLVITLFSSIAALRTILLETFTNDYFGNSLIPSLISCILWSIWYFYYLH
jgi:hypothetical protein